MKLSLSPRAATDLEEIADFIARDNPSRAVSFIQELETRCFKIAETPEAFPARDDIAPGIRLGVHGRYLILFRIMEDTVRVERVVHGARRTNELV